MKIKTIFSLTLSAAVMLVAQSPVYAGMGSYGQSGTTPSTGQYGQYGQYGGATPAQSIVVDKKVASGTMTKGGVTNYVDNFSPADPRFNPGAKVYFQVKVKNTSNTKVTNVMVKDVVPAYVEPVEGPGAYDPKTRTITYTLPELNPGQEDVKYFLMQVVAQDKLPADKGLMCTTNRAEAQSGGMKDDDTAQFCIEKVVTNVQQAPAAGPEFGLAVVALQAAGLGAGMYLRKRK